jgi:hypothetical protein
MKTAEILRNILNLLDAEEQEAQQQPVVVNINNGDTAQDQSTETPVADNELGVMVPPLQQKIELAKKAHGVDSVYAPVDDEEPDELDIIKQNAGLSTAIAADEDEPLEG